MSFISIPPNSSHPENYQPGSLGALWPALSLLCRLFLLPKALVLPDKPGPQPSPCTRSLLVVWKLCMPSVDGAGMHRGTFALKRVPGPLDGCSQCGTNSCCPPGAWFPHEHIDLGSTGHFHFPRLYSWPGILVTGGIELGEKGCGSQTSFSLLLPLAFTASSEALERCYSRIHSFIY